MTAPADTDTYRGLPGAFPYAFRRSGSWLFRCYVIVGGALALAVSVVFVLGLIVVVAETLDTTATLSFSRAFFLLVGLLVVAPMLAPVLLVARRHRRGVGDDASYDRRLAIGGFGFMAAIYLGLVISSPPAQQANLDGPLAPVLEALYALPGVLGLVPPIAAVVAIYLAHRLSR